MNHRIVSTVVTIIVALFAVAAGLFAWVAVVVTPANGAIYAPDNPHPPAPETDACLDCHTTAEGTIPVTHRHYAVETCGWCHRPSVRVLVPHSVSMGEARCVLCHGEPGRDLGMPEGHRRFDSDGCLLCHPVDERFANRRPAPAGLSLAYAMPTPHPAGGIFERCDYCHHVDPRSNLPENHRDFAVETCLDCHRAGAE